MNRMARGLADQDYEPFTQDEFAQWTNSRRWQFSDDKHHPHWRTLGKWGDVPPYTEEGFERAVATVHVLGVKSTLWGQSANVYFHAEGMRYWTDDPSRNGSASVLYRTFTQERLIEVVRRDPRKEAWSIAALEAFAETRMRSRA